MTKEPVIRVAWLLPVAWFYWQPAISEFTRKFPETKIFTALWPGYAKGYENSLHVDTIGQWKVLNLSSSQVGYGSSFTYVSPTVIFPLIRFRPNIIFTNAFGVWTLLALLLKLIMRWQVIITYEGSSPGVDFNNSRYRLFLRRGMLKLADAAISNSHAGRTYLTQVLQLPDEKAFAFPYEVPSALSLLSSDEDQESHPQDPHPVFLFVGRIIPRKGLHTLLEACRTLAQKGYQDYTLLIVGDGEQRSELEAYSTSHDLNSCIQWVGRVDYDKIDTYFHRADVFLLPTLEDTWGVVVLEAMLFGKAILCSTGAGTAELIHDGKNGYVFDPEDSTYLADMMRRFIDQPNLANIMGLQSKQMMMEYTPEKAAQFLAQVVAKISHQEFALAGQPAQEKTAP